MNCNIYLITCDKSKEILNVTIPLLEKYWNIEKSVKILGFGELDINLPINYEFISMKPKQLSIDDWCSDIHSIIKKDNNDYVIFMLDDFLPIDYVNIEILEYYYNSLTNDNRLVRCALGIDMSFLPHRIIEKYNQFSVIELAEHSQYRITTQCSIWRKDYLLYFLNKSTNPWNFETDNNPIDGKKIIGTVDNHCFRYIEESALSGRHSGMINVLGLRPNDVNWLIDLGLLDKDRLQYGQYVGNVPTYNALGLNFTLDKLKNYISESKYEEYLIKYGKYYK